MAKAVFIASRKIALHSTHNAHIASKIMSQLLLCASVAFQPVILKLPASKKVSKENYERWKRKKEKVFCYAQLLGKKYWLTLELTSHINQFVFDCVSNKLINTFFEYIEKRYVLRKHIQLKCKSKYVAKKVHQSQFETVLDVSGKCNFCKFEHMFSN